MNCTAKNNTFTVLNTEMTQIWSGSKESGPPGEEVELETALYLTLPKLVNKVYKRQSKVWQWCRKWVIHQI